MRTLRIVIADDETPARSAMKRALSKIDGVELVGEAVNGVELVALVSRLDPDIAFIDIQMPGLNGLEASSLMNKHGATSVVFVTAHMEFAVEAFEREALDYIVKPVRVERVAASIDRIRKLGGLRLEEAVFEPGSTCGSKVGARVIVRSGGSLRPLELGDIELAEAAGNYVRAHVGDRTHLIRISLTELVEKCSGGLIRVHRSFALRGGDVDELVRREGEDPTARLHSGRLVPIGRTYWSAVRKTLGG